MKIAYINFLNHCYVDTEVEMKEIYTSNHMWKLFDDFLVDICRVRNISSPPPAYTRELTQNALRHTHTYTVTLSFIWSCLIQFTYGFLA